MELDQNYQKKPLVLQDKHRLKINRQKFMMSFVIAEQKIRCKLLPCCQARARSTRAGRACALRALGLLLADGTPTGGRGEDFLSHQPDFFTETAVTSERKVEKSFPRWEINRHIEG